MDDTQRDIGWLEAKQEAMEERLGRMESKLDTVVETLAEAKGSWKTIMAISGMAGAVGSAVTWIISHLPSLSK